MIPPNFAPAYAAACYPEFAAVARRHGYALAVHGSLARDMDLIAIPWTADAGSPHEILHDLQTEFAVRLVGAVEDKPHGRTAYTLSIGFGECSIDMQFMPRKGTS